MRIFSYSLEAGFTTVVQIPTIVEGGIVGFGFRVITVSEDEQILFPAERKSLYDDLETLRRFGFPIETRKSRTFAYYLSQRTFSPGDVALLAEAVRQAPGLSPRKVSQLLKKLGTLCSQYQAQALLSGGPVEEPPAQEETVPEPAAGPSSGAFRWPSRLSPGS